MKYTHIHVYPLDISDVEKNHFLKHPKHHYLNVINVRQEL